MKFSLLMILISLSLNARAEAPCDVRPGTSLGINVIEFTSGHIIHSKMPLIESTAVALKEEMVNLQDMGICTEMIFSKKCVLKFEKKNKVNSIIMLRGTDKWNSWGISSKAQAQNYVIDLRKAGFCS
ncbi:MAG TPA: hypothetical protein VNJ01_15225 [Bacteriovoracaceae bacterium]|nr:hypothetical protein [Bacteriovoracaceae bacterium]